MCAGPDGDTRPKPLRWGAQRHRLRIRILPRRHQEPYHAEGPQGAGREHDPTPPLEPPDSHDTDRVRVHPPPLCPAQRELRAAQGAAFKRLPDSLLFHVSQMLCRP
jgi:hypothetical protein